MSDIDLDQLLEEIQGNNGNIINPINQINTNKDGNNQTINSTEDDFFKFLDDPSQSSTSNPTIKYDNPINSDDPEDFLDWLNTDTTTSQSKLISMPEESVVISQDIESISKSKDDDIIQITNINLAEDNIPTASVNVEDDNDDDNDEEEDLTITKNIQSVDNFFDEVFGKSPIYPSSQSSIEGNSSTTQDMVSLDERIKLIINSNFPDIDKLQIMIHEAGYIPPTLRAQVWSLLLTEATCTEDEEIIHYDDSTNGMMQYDKKQLIITDCNAVITNATTIYTNLNNKNTVDLEIANKDMQDILLLYCQRRKVDYKPVFCRILSTLLIGNPNHRFSRAIASSCFYSIASEFLPLVNLHPTAQSLGINLTHNWLKVLLSYHSPALVQHLDRVLPQWEEPSKEISSSQAISMAASRRGSDMLDELERELGLDTIHNTAIVTTVSVDSENNNPSSSSTLPPGGKVVIESAPSGSSALLGSRTGCIPSHWITGIFSSSMPVTESALLLDWAILNNQKYTGFYLTVALLCLYAQELISMSGSKVRQWFEDIETNKMDWYKSSTVLPVNKETNQLEIPGDWVSFVKGWLQATTALVNSTPKAFQKALSEIESWASVAADQQSLDKNSKHSFSNNQSSHSSIPSNNNSLHGNIHDLTNKDQLQYNPTGNDTNDNEEYYDRYTSSSSSEQLGKDDSDSKLFNGNTTVSGKVNLMEKFRKLSMSFQNDLNDQKNQNQPQQQQSGEDQKRFVHDRIMKYNPICIWSSVEEVIPCICSNRRRTAISTVHIFNCYYNTAIKVVPQDEKVQITTGSRSGGGVYGTSCFLMAKCLEIQAPFFFGIDCRSSTEIALGQFPKAYAFDPAGLTDGEAVTKLLDAIETLASTSTVHICIIGVGEAYIKKQYKQTSRDKKDSNARKQELLHVCVSEYYAKLNAVAMFFLKRSFKYISILDGGFMAAVDYFLRPDSPFNMDTSLVEINRLALDEALGISSTANIPQRTNFVSTIGNLFQTMAVSNKSNNPVPPPATSATTTSLSRSASATNVPSSDNKSNEVSSAIPIVTTEQVPANLNPNSKEQPHDNISSTTSDNKPIANTATNTVSASTANTSTDNLFSSWGKKWTASLETLKKYSVAPSTSNSTAIVNAEQVSNSSTNTNNSINSIKESNKEKGAFVIDDNEDDGMGPKEIADTTTISINKTEREKEQALALHRMTGLNKGEQVTINRQDLPGAVLFPSIKYKEILVEDPNFLKSQSEQINVAKTTSSSTVETASEVEAGVEAKAISSNLTTDLIENPTDINISIIASNDKNQIDIPKIKQQIQVHRYLVVSRERFIVLDSHGGGVGSKAIVKSNRHLTELIKMTFRKKDPEFVTLYFANKENKPSQYRISKRNEFIASLQVGSS